jgi:hypothetical protein
MRFGASQILAFNRKFGAQPYFTFSYTMRSFSSRG